MSARGQRRPRVVLLTYPSLCGAAIIQQMARESGIELVGIGLSGRVFKGANHYQAVRRMISRTGVRFTAYAVAMTDVAWLALRALGRPRALARTNLSVRSIRDVNSAATCQWLHNLAPDYVASCYFNQLIGPEVIHSGTSACVNLHTALLPALRGPEPCFRALERDLTVTGLTIHRVDQGIDTGPVLHQERRTIWPGTSLGELDARLWSEGARVLAEWLALSPRVAGGLPNGGRGPADYDTWPTAREVACFRARGKRLLDAGTYLRCLRDVALERPPGMTAAYDTDGVDPA